MGQAMRRITRLEIFPIVVGVAILVGAIVLNPAPPDPVVHTLSVAQQIVGVAVDDRTGRTFVATSGDSGGGRVDVLDTASGALLRVLSMPGQPLNIIGDGQGGQVFVETTANGVGRMAVLSARGTGPIRTLPLSVGVYAAPLAIDEHAGHLFVAVPAFAACYRAVMFAPCSRVSVYDIRRGRVLRTFGVRGQVAAMAVDQRANRFVTTSVVNSGTGFVSVFDATTGRLVGSVSVGSQVGFPSDHMLALDEARGHVFVLSTNAPTFTNGNVYMLDVHNGALLHVDALNSSPTDIAVDSRAGRVFVSQLGPVTGGGFASRITSIGVGGVDVLDARSGRLLRTITTGVGTFAMAVDGRAGRVVVVNVGKLDSNGPATFVGAGTVSILDAQNEQIVRTAPTGVFPVSIAVDERRSRAIVVNAGGTVGVSGPWGWVPPWLRRALPFLPRPSGRTRAVPASVTVLDPAR